VNIAKDLGKTPAQICLRWCMQKGAIVIPKAGSEEHLRENMDIFDWQLSEEDMKRIDSQ
jgi:diketogulonate reductase-like aldo/keto reductase